MIIKKKKGVAGSFTRNQIMISAIRHMSEQNSIYIQMLAYFHTEFEKILPPEKVEEIFGSEQMSALYEQSAISIQNCSIDIINDGTNNIFIEECRPK